MIRRYNYTGRRSLARNDTQIFLEDDQRNFRASIRLGDYGLPARARVFVEAYRQTTLARFDFGTVAELSAPENRSLVEFEGTEGILFRVKVTGVDGFAAGRLLAHGDQIPPQREGDAAAEAREPLLPVQPTELGEEIFRVEFPENRPVLSVNRRVGDWRALARSPAFLSLAYPQVLRQILGRVLWVERHYELEPADDWRAQWLQYATALPGCSELPDGAEETRFEDWIDSVVDAFCRRHRIFDQFNIFWSEEAAS